MGIERKEMVTVEYRCDRCDAIEEVRAERYVQANPGREWITVAVNTIPTSAQFIDRVLCESCKTAFQAWFQGAA